MSLENFKRSRLSSKSALKIFSLKQVWIANELWSQDSGGKQDL